MQSHAGRGTAKNKYTVDRGCIMVKAEMMA